MWNQNDYDNRWILLPVLLESSRSLSMCRCKYNYTSGCLECATDTQDCFSDELIESINCALKQMQEGVDYLTYNDVFGDSD